MNIKGSAKLANVFRPALPIDAPTYFAGRRSEIKQTAEALAVDGSVILLYGERGLGKTSIARQTERIAQGDVELLDDMALLGFGLSEDDRYRTVYVECNDEIQSTNQLMKLLIEKTVALSETSESKVPSTKTIKEKVSAFKVYEHETTKVFTSSDDEPDSTLCERLRTATTALWEQSGHRTLFLVDEFDRINDSSGFASVLKTLSCEFLKFILVGIGNSVATLLADHESLNRQLRPIEVPTMASGELKRIVELVELNDLQRFSLSFGSDAKESIAELSGGYPWFVHILGQESLMLAVRKKETKVTQQHVHSCQSRLSRSIFAQQFETLYLSAVGHSKSSEIVLRTYSMWSRPEIPTSQVYPVCRSLDVKHPANHTRSFCKNGVLRAALGKKRGFYIFSNSMFRRYIQLRPSIFEGVASDVRRAWLDSRGTWTGRIQCGNCEEKIWKLKRIECPKCKHPLSPDNYRRIYDAD